MKEQNDRDYSVTYLGTPERAVNRIVLQRGTLEDAAAAILEALRARYALPDFETVRLTFEVQPILTAEELNRGVS